MKTILFTSILLLSSICLVYAQDTGYMAGLVTDSAGIRLPNIAIEIQNPARLDSTDENGNFIIEGLNTGYYGLTVRGHGFVHRDLDSIYVAAPETTMLYIRLLRACPYIPGDINGNGSMNGIDITYGVGYFKGGNLPPLSCECPPGSRRYIYVAGDVNSDCYFNGIDISYFVNYFKGGAGPVMNCDGCPPAFE